MQPYYVESYPQPIYTEYLPATEFPAELPTENVGLVETGLVTPQVTAENFDGPSVIPATAKASEYQALAEQAFRENRYEDAIRQSTHAVIEDGENGKLHLFASQIFFALGDYRASAAAIQRGASLLDRSEWGYVVENFKQFYRGKDYVNQMDALVQFTKENPDIPFVHFLRGYHYKYLGYDEAARAPLARAVELESQDRLAAELLVMAGGQVPESAKPANPVPVKADEQPPANLKPELKAPEPVVPADVKPALESPADVKPKIISPADLKPEIISPADLKQELKSPADLKPELKAPANATPNEPTPAAKKVESTENPDSPPSPKK